MSLTTSLIVNAVVLALVLAFDLGRRTFDNKAVVRSAIICGAVALLFVKDFYTDGVGLTVEIIGVALGALIGLLAVSLMKVDKHPDNTVHTVAGAGYAVVWAGMAVARSLLSLGMTYWFGTAVGTWLVKQGAAPTDITGLVTNFLVFMAVAALLTRTLTIRARAAAIPHAPSATAV
ncbi:hypothetical protein [Streptomyces sp. NPDC088812]|uniref:hypothetical protein n=1 Tax=Streptomyces sp. NPDC088812 TaxID=3365905 RepID=UPI00380E9BF4